MRAITPSLIEELHERVAFLTCAVSALAGEALSNEAHEGLVRALCDIKQIVVTLQVDCDK